MSDYEHRGPVEDTPMSRGAYSENETMRTAPFEPRRDYGPPVYRPYGMTARLSYLRRQYPVETRPFYLTSEFAAAVLAVVALAITAGASSTIDAWRFWQLATAITVAYLLSRGIAKAGSSSPARDPRDELDRS